LIITVGGMVGLIVVALEVACLNRDKNIIVARGRGLVERVSLLDLGGYVLDDFDDANLKLGA
jgi:hypothetical protein